MTARLQVTSAQHPGCRVLRVTGEVDAFNARTFTLALEEHASVGEPLILDLSAVEFMDSSACYAMLRAHQDFEQHGRRMILVPSPAVQVLVDVTGVQQTLTISPSIYNALTICRDPAR